MAEVATFANIVGVLVAAMIPLAGLFQSGEVSTDQMTTVEFIVGNEDGSMGGNIPDIDLFNERGEPTARWTEIWDTKLAPGASHTVKIPYSNEIYATRWWPPVYEQYASYILLTAKNADAICISALYVNDARIQTVIFGDIAAQCGASWGIGSRPVTQVGTNEIVRPKCFWLDSDGSNGINARSASFHLRDMVAAKGRAKQYEENIDTLCKSTPRYAWWPNLKAHSWIPIFNPKLEYVDTGNDTGRDVDLSRIVDTPGQYDRNAEWYEPPGMDRPWQDVIESDDFIYETDRRQSGYHKGKVRRRSPLPNRLIVTPYPEHSARELCESATSHGPDTVSLNEGLFCDMDTKTLFTLCDENAAVTTNCFQLETHMLVLANGTEVGQDLGDEIHVKRQEVPTVPKVYTKTDYW